MGSAKNPSRILLDNVWNVSLLAHWETHCSGPTVYQLCTVLPPGPDSYRILPLYFVLMCFSLPGEYKKLLA